jgi:hypothetical protein
MRPRPDRARRTVLGALVVCGVGAATNGFAQDAQTSIVQKSARDWLALIDRMDTVGSWNAAGTRFKAVITEAKWGTSLRQVRTPLGAFEQRSMLSTTFTKQLPDGSEGEFALVLCRTVFAKKVDNRETVTLERESDGVWRVIGYSL